MAIVESIEQTLNGGYGGLFGEVVDSDIYRMKQLDFKPDMIFDIGANVGVFSRFAVSLFPGATIVAVEPDKENFDHFNLFTKSANIRLYWRCIGRGEVWRYKDAANGAHECYVTKMMGFPLDDEDVDLSRLVKAGMPTVMLNELVDVYLKPEMKSMIKIDCEGGENAIFDDEKSMNALRRFDFIAMELHYHAMNQDLLVQVKEKTAEALKSLEETHHCELVHPMFYAKKK